MRAKFSDFAAPSRGTTTSDGTGQRRTKYYKDRPEAVARRNVRINAISRIAYSIVGGAKKFYALTKNERLAIRQTAARLHDAGSTYVKAAVNEKREKDGFIYVITNPAFPGCVKVGSALNPESRLADFQTYCPRRGFVLEHYVYASDRHAAEALAHEVLAQCRLEGEWYETSVAHARAVIDSIAEQFEIRDLRRAFLSREQHESAEGSH